MSERSTDAVWPLMGWEIAKWNHEHEVAPTTNAMDWIDEYQAAVAAFPTGPTPLPEIYERIATLTALGMIVLGELPHPTDIDDLDSYEDLFEE